MGSGGDDEKKKESNEKKGLITCHWSLVKIIEGRLEMCVFFIYCSSYQIWCSTARQRDKDMRERKSAYCNGEICKFEIKMEHLM